MIAIEQKNTTNSSTVVLGMAYPPIFCSHP
jgi:hypothetical protein